MSKAVLVMEMPDCCFNCPFLDGDESCIVESLSYTDVEVTSEKPYWCPLVPFPARQKPLNKKGYRSGYIEGWNDAIDAIDSEA